MKTRVFSNRLIEKNLEYYGNDDLDQITIPLRVLKKHPKYRNQLKKRWEKLNPDRARETRKRYYQSHKETISAKMKEKRRQSAQ